MGCPRMQSVMMSFLYDVLALETSYRDITVGLVLPFTSQKPMKEGVVLPLGDWQAYQAFAWKRKPRAHECMQHFYECNDLQPQSTIILTITYQSTTPEEDAGDWSRLLKAQGPDALVGNNGNSYTFKIM